MDNFEAAATTGHLVPAEDEEVYSNGKLHLLSKEAKLQRRRYQIRVSQVRHREKKARYLEELELTTATLRAMITTTRGEVSVLCKENEDIKATLGSIVLNTRAQNYPTTVAVGGGIRNAAAGNATCDTSPMDLPVLVGNIDATQTAEPFGNADSMELSMLGGSVENAELEGQPNDVNVADSTAFAYDCNVPQPTGLFDNAGSVALGTRERSIQNIEADGQTGDYNIMGFPAFVGESHALQMNDLFGNSGHPILVMTEVETTVRYFYF